MRQEYLLAAAGIGGALGLAVLPKYFKVGARIDGISPFSLITVNKGATVNTTVTFTNTGSTQWTFYVGLSFMDQNNAIYDVPVQAVTLGAGAQGSATLAYTFNTAGTYQARSSIWRVNPVPGQTPESDRLADTGWKQNVVGVVEIVTASITRAASNGTQWYP